jgi:hypothetical protein
MNYPHQKIILKFLFHQTTIQTINHKRLCIYSTEHQVTKRTKKLISQLINMLNTGQIFNLYLLFISYNNDI